MNMNSSLNISTKHIWKLSALFEDKIIDSAWDVLSEIEVYRIKNYISSSWPFEYWPTWNAPEAQMFNQALKQYTFSHK